MTAGWIARGLPGFERLAPQHRLDVDGRAPVRELVGLNETIEFLSTVARAGGHLDGYTNTGWDLVYDLVGVAGSLLVVHRRPLTSIDDRR